MFIIFTVPSSLRHLSNNTTFEFLGSRGTDWGRGLRFFRRESHTHRFLCFLCQVRGSLQVPSSVYHCKFLVVATVPDTDGDSSLPSSTVSWKIFSDVPDPDGPSTRKTSELVRYVSVVPRLRSSLMSWVSVSSPPRVPPTSGTLRPRVPSGTLLDRVGLTSLGVVVVCVSWSVRGTGPSEIL